MLLVTSLMGTQGVGSCPYAPNPEKEAQVDTTQSHLMTFPPAPYPQPSLLPALLCLPQPGSRCTCRGKSSGCPAGDRRCRGRRSPPDVREGAREWP